METHLRLMLRFVSARFGRNSELLPLNPLTSPQTRNFAAISSWPAHSNLWPKISSSPCTFSFNLQCLPSPISASDRTNSTQPKRLFFHFNDSNCLGQTPQTRAGTQLQRLTSEKKERRMLCTPTLSFRGDHTLLSCQPHIISS